MSKSTSDPAITSAAAHRCAGENLNSAGASNPAAFEKASKKYSETAGAFADTVPTTADGAIAKLCQVLDCDFNDDAAQQTLSARHVRNVVAYLGRLA